MSWANNSVNIDNSTIQNKKQFEPDLLEMVARQWISIAIVTLMCAFLGLAATPLIPKKYSSHCTIFAQQKSGILNSLSLSLPNAPLNLIAGGTSQSDYLAAVLRSDAHARRVSVSLGLRSNPFFTGKKGKKISDYWAIQKIKKSTVISDDRRGSLRITVTTRDPQLSAKIANEFAAQLRGSVSTANRRKREFIEQQLYLTENRLDKAAESLKEFQNRSKTISLDTQTEANIKALAELQGRLTTAKVELREVESGLQTAGNPLELAKLKSQKASLDSRIQYLESEITAFEKRLSELPNIAMQLARLQRNVEVQKKIYEVLTEQYQLASIAEQSEDTLFEVVDPALPAEKPSWPKRSVNAALGGLLGFAIGAILAVQIEQKRIKRSN